MDFGVGHDFMASPYLFVSLPVHGFRFHFSSVFRYTATFLWWRAASWSVAIR